MAGENNPWLGRGSKPRRRCYWIMESGPRRGCSCPRAPRGNNLFCARHDKIQGRRNWGGK